MVEDISMENRETFGRTWSLHYHGSTPKFVGMTEGTMKDTQDMKLSRLTDVLKSSRAISHISIGLKTNVSEISSVSIIRVEVMNGHVTDI
jgi:hypothetical protein